MAKSKYETHVLPKLKLVEAWSRNGLTLDQIAKNLGIATSTLFLYKERYSEFSEALKIGKEVADLEVENALYKLATGFEYTEDAVTNKGTVVQVTRYEKPSVTAIIFYLKNRLRHKWMDNPAKHDLDREKFEFEKLQAAKEDF